MAAKRRNITVPLLPGQKRVFAAFNAGAPVVGFVGGLGAGKTRIGALMVIREALTYRRNYIAVAAATYPQLRRSTIRAVIQALKDLRIVYKYNKSTKTVLIPQAGSEIEFVSTDVPPEELQGPEYGALWVDEGEGVEESRFRALRFRVRKRGASRRVLVTANPPGRYHWISQSFHFEPIPGWAYVNAQTFENMLLPADYVYELKLLYPEGSHNYRRYLLGELGLPREGAVYPEFSAERHIVDSPPANIIGHFGGLDLGADHPFCFLQMGLTDTDIIVVLGEHYARLLPIDEHLMQMHQVYRGGPIFSDWAKQDRIEMDMRGWPTIAAPKQIGVETGIEAIRRRLLLRKFLIVRGAAPNLVREFSTYVWSKPPRENTAYVEKPVKVNDDALDALRYGVTGLDYASAVAGDAMRQVFAELKG